MRHLPLLLALAVAQPAFAAAPKDPFDSPTWEALHETLLGGGAVRFDPRVRVSVPMLTENQRSFPVTVDARGVGAVRRIVLFADLNPIAEALSFEPLEAEAYIATRIKLDQATPVRAAVQLTDGSWLVNGTQVDAAGGGCSLPPLSRARGDWATSLGQVRGRVWRDGTSARVRLAFRHPMDTGFVANIAAFHLETVDVKGADGRVLGRVALKASVAEDPTLTLIARVRPGDRAIQVSSRDTNGNRSGATLVIANSLPSRLASR